MLLLKIDWLCTLDPPSKSLFSAFVSRLQVEKHAVQMDREITSVLSEPPEVLAALVLYVLETLHVSQTLIPVSMLINLKEISGLLLIKSILINYIFIKKFSFVFSFQNWRSQRIDWRVCNCG